METCLKVLFITRKWAPAVGGMETYSMELTTELEKYADLTVRFLPGKRDGHPPKLPVLLWFLIGSAVFLWKKRKSFDIIHYGDMVLFPLAFFNSLWGTQAKQALTIHGLDILYDLKKGIKAKAYRLFLKWARMNYSRVDCYIANSHNTSRIARDRGFHPTISIPLGTRIEENKRFRERNTKELPYVLFVGRIVKRKGAGWFAEKVLPCLPEPIKFCVAGKVWDKDEFSTLENHPRVEYLGYVDDEELNELRRNALVMVMPNIRTSDGSDVEGFGIATLEAAAMGVPLVASNLEGIKDAVRQGETGFLVPPEAPKAWVEMINGIGAWNESRRIVFGQQAIKKVQEHYSWNRVARDTFEIYHRLWNETRNHFQKK